MTIGMRKLCSLTAASSFLIATACSGQNSNPDKGRSGTEPTGGTGGRNSGGTGFGGNGFGGSGFGGSGVGGTGVGGSGFGFSGNQRLVIGPTGALLDPQAEQIDFVLG